MTSCVLHLGFHTGLAAASFFGDLDFQKELYMRAIRIGFIKVELKELIRSDGQKLARSGSHGFNLAFIAAQFH